MADIEILRSVDIENTVRHALLDKFTIYCPPLPANFTTPSLEVTQVGGTVSNKIDTFSIVLDSRAESEATAMLNLRNAIGMLKAVADAQTTALRHVTVNSSGSWGSDPARPDLAMCSARLEVVAHQEITTI